MQPVEKKTSPWLYVGIGCGVLLLLGIGGTVAAVMFGASKLQEIKEDMANPVARTEKVKKLLGADTLPEGYHAVMALSVPAIMDTAMISTRAPEDKGPARDGGDRMFLYFFMKASTLNDQEELRAYLEGRSDDASVLERNGIHARGQEVLGRGAIDLKNRRVLYVSHRGVLQSNQTDNKGPTLNSVLFIDCPGQTQLRMSLWMAQDPAPGTPTEELNLKGTPVDQEAIRDFMSHLNPCQGS